MKKMFFLLSLLIFLNQTSFSAYADEPKKDLTEEIGRGIIAVFRPESLTVRVDNGLKLAWVETTGAVFDKVRVEKMRLLALLKETPANFNLNDKNALGNLISSSKGEVVLLEKDVNAYFASSDGVSGFSKLNFTFSEKGFKSEGLFSADFLFGLTIKLNALGRLGLRPDGVYLEDTTIIIGGRKQSDSLSSLIVGRINPLLSFSKNPFPIEFTEIKMTKSAVIMKSALAPLSTGRQWKWARP